MLMQQTDWHIQEIWSQCVLEVHKKFKLMDGKECRCKVETSLLSLTGGSSMPLTASAIVRKHEKMQEDPCIKDMGGNACIVCPWHRYKITLSAGHGLYMALDPFNDEKPELKSKGAKQRTHTVTLKDGQVFVTLSPMDSELDSDRYNSVEYRQKFSLQ